MKFLLEVHHGLLEQRYRLLRDGSWRDVGDMLTTVSDPPGWINGLSEDDMLFDSLNEIRPYTEVDSLVINGKRYQTNPNGRNLLDELANCIEVSPKVLRTTKPHRFTIDELCKAIRYGDDNYHNTAVVRLDGSIELMKLEKAMEKLAPIAVRHEAFCAGNGYVGITAAWDKTFIYESYIILLEGWVSHLRSCSLDLYVDCQLTNKTENDLWKEVEMLTNCLGEN